MRLNLPDVYHWRTRHAGVKALWMGLLLTCVSGSPTIAEDVELPTTGLAISGVSRGGRTPFQPNLVEAAIAEGSWKFPRPGDSMHWPDGSSRQWTTIEASEDGTFQSKELRNGFLHLTVQSPDYRVCILETNGAYASSRINGEPRPGDNYGTGWVRIPVALNEGANELLFHVTRGSLRVSLSEPTSPLVLDARDATWPQFLMNAAVNAGKARVTNSITGELMPAAQIGTGVWAALLVINATDETRRDLSIVTTRSDGRTMTTPLAPIPPLTTRKVPFQIEGLDVSGAGEMGVRIDLISMRQEESQPMSTLEVTLPKVDPKGAHHRTFVSEIDGSVQYYAVQPPPRDERDDQVGLILTLHGASVDATNQRNQYSPKPWAYVVAPTNRRPYGFDWEDWGWLDAQEVMGLASSLFGTDPLRQWLTGHSMGGHGTWAIGTLAADRFAAIGPSAGWISFSTYAGGARFDDSSAVERMFQRAANASDTFARKENLKPVGVYILHGDRDDNVPVEQARTMVEALARFHQSFAYHEQPGAGHWWGARCCDWPAMMDFFKSRTIPRMEDITRVEFTTPNPALWPSAHWVLVISQQRWSELSRVDMTYDAANRRFAGTTENVEYLMITPAPVPMDQDFEIVLDDTTINTRRSAQEPWALLQRVGDDWQITQLDDPINERKGPHRAGPFKHAFNHRAVLVYGTHGDEAENKWAYAKARYDSETFWYRGNGSFEVVADVDFVPDSYEFRNVILYGNADTNSAWHRVLPETPVRFESGRAVAGDRVIMDDAVGGLFVYPRLGSDTNLVGVVTGTGVHGMELTTKLPYFVSGVHYPDFCLFDQRVFTDGPAGVIGAGYFDSDWSLRSNDIAWREN